MIKCKDLMTKNLILCNQSTPVYLLAMIMQAENIGFIPVLRGDRASEIVGVVTDRDITIRMVSESLDSEYCLASRIMSKNVISVNESDAIRVAMAKMMEFRIKRIVVLNRQHAITGVLTTGDIANCRLFRKRTGQLMKEISRRNVSTTVA